MRTAPRRRWATTSEKTGLLLFAQRLNELLFDFSLDTYQAPALNTHSRSREFLDAVRSVLTNGLKPQALKPMAEELARSITEDPAAKALLGAAADQVCESHYWDIGDLHELQTRAEWVRRHLGGGRYREEVVRQLRELLSDAREKERILTLTRDLAVEWINDGYPKEAIYHHCNRAFFEHLAAPVAGIGDFDAFVAWFTRPQEEFTVWIRGNSAFRMIAQETLPSSVTLHQSAPQPRTKGKREAAFLAEVGGPVFISVTTKATDAASARWNALRLVQFFSGAAQLHIHRSPFVWESTVLVYPATGKGVLLQEPTRAMEKHEDCAKDALPSRTTDTLQAFANPTHVGAKSYERFLRALSLHTAAVTSASPENQLLSLWAALETLLPMGASDSRIGRITELMVPILSHSYPLRLVEALHSDLEALATNAYLEALAKVPDVRTKQEALAAVLSVKAYWPFFDDLNASLDDNPLLRFRIYSLASTFHTPALLRGLIDRHATRVGWQLHRIYRARNFVTHSGRRMPYLGAVVENVHAYLHTLLARLESTLLRAEHLRGIDQALLHARLEYDTHVRALKRGGEAECTPETFRRFVFGPVN